MLKTRNIELIMDDAVDPHLRASVYQYCAALTERGFPPIISGEQLALSMGVDPSYLFGVTNSQRFFYRSFSIPKRKGGLRSIEEPLPLLKLIQRWILDNILSNVPIEKCVNSYCEGKSIKSNARLHIGQKKLLKIDVTNFFGSINFNLIFDVFYNIGYSRAVSVTLANLCCLDGRLPQGAPTSGYISNIVLSSFDEMVLKFCLERKMRYTRYADDLAFSGPDFSEAEVSDFVEKQLRPLGLKLNLAKTKLLKQSARQIVTGVVVNKKLAVPKWRRHKIRQEIFYIKKYGIDEHAKKINADPERALRRILGECTYVNHIHSTDVFPKDDVLLLRKILSKYSDVGDVYR